MVHIVMQLNFHFIVPTIIILVIGVPSVFAITLPSIDFDMDLIDLKVVDIHTLSMGETQDYYVDGSDLLKITINVTNNGVDYFLLNDRMLKIWMMKPVFKKSSPDIEFFVMADNYFTSYNDGLEVQYKNLASRELFEECEKTHERIRIGQSKVFTVCYDILRMWHNEILNIDGPNKYSLVMMNNQQKTSCPNCKRIPLSPSEPTLKYQIPDWVQNLYEWNQQGIISDQEFEFSIKYLVAVGIIFEDKEKIPPTTLEIKNMQLKKHHDRLSLAQQTNLYVSLVNFYESLHDDEIFSGVLCKKQNNIVTLSGDYTNDDSYYQAIFFKLQVFDELNNVVATGLSKAIDFIPKEIRHFSVSTPYIGEINNCLVMVDSRFK